AAQGAGSLTLPITLPGVLGSVTVSFDDVTGLTPAHLGVSSQLISPLNLNLLSRLPATVSLLPDFPVLVRIVPPVSGGLTFTGIASVDLLSLQLPGIVNLLPMRLYGAHDGGTFTDITERQPSTKTYRAIGVVGGFSEFLLVLDFTPASRVIIGKLDRLSQILTDNAA